MDCPACSNKLSLVKVNNVDIDVCSNGCAGIWFDNYEFEKFDEAHENDSTVLLDIAKDSSIKVNYSEKRPCPKCDNITMMRHFFSVKHEVEMDECGFCGGIWLDSGELSHLHSLFVNESGKRAAFEEMFNNMFGDDMEALANETKKREESRRKRTAISKLLWRLS